MIKEFLEKVKERYDECVMDHELDAALICCKLTNEDEDEDLIVCKRLCGFEIKVKIMCFFKSVFNIFSRKMEDQEELG